MVPFIGIGLFVPYILIYSRVILYYLLPISGLDVILFLTLLLFQLSFILLLNYNLIFLLIQKYA